jgi:hypothetical protein
MSYFVKDGSPVPKQGFHIRHFSDWIEFYKDGTLLAEGHSLDAASVLDALGYIHSTDEVKADD